jgi:hypothetical protein
MFPRDRTGHRWQLCGAGTSGTYAWHGSEIIRCKHMRPSNFVKIALKSDKYRRFDDVLLLLLLLLSVITLPAISLSILSIEISPPI